MSAEMEQYKINYNEYDSGIMDWVCRDQVLGILYQVGSCLDVGDEEGDESRTGAIDSVDESRCMVHHNR